MPDYNISKAQPSKAKGLGGVFPLRSKNAALLYMYRFNLFLGGLFALKGFEYKKSKFMV